MAGLFFRRDFLRWFRFLLFRLNPFRFGVGDCFSLCVPSLFLFLDLTFPDYALLSGTFLPCTLGPRCSGQALFPLSQFARFLHEAFPPQCPLNEDPRSAATDFHPSSF